jgi:hypothetical protein
MQNTMTPEERAELRQMLDDMDSTDAPAEGGDKYEDVCKLLDLLIQDNKLMHDEINMLREAVLNEFDGMYNGFQSLYDKEEKIKGVSSLKEKYGSNPAFQEFDKIKQHTEEKDTDIFDKLYDLRKQAQADAGEGFNDDDFVEKFAAAINETIAKLKAEGTIPQEAEVEVKLETGGEGPDELDPVLRENIERYKKTAIGKRL